MDLCEHCGNEMPPQTAGGRQRKYCGTRCRVAAFRGRLVLDLFAGIGGWDIALQQLGMRCHGVEKARPPRATRALHGLRTVGRDIQKFTPRFNYYGVVGSPPCQAFSQAGQKGGLDDPRGELVYEPLRIVAECRPEFVALENVRGAMPHFAVMAEDLAASGYHVDARVVCASDYGLPQRRVRALLVARKSEPINWPAPTHHNSEVTAAEALPWRDDLPGWAHERAATTVVGSFASNIISPPGHRDPAIQRHQSPEGFEVSVAERLVLQGFPRDFGLVGGARAQALMVGNAIPPVLARVALAACGFGNDSFGAAPAFDTSWYDEQISPNVMLEPDAYDAFVAELDRPAREIPQLRELMNRTEPS